MSAGKDKYAGGLSAGREKYAEGLLVKKIVGTLEKNPSLLIIFVSLMHLCIHISCYGNIHYLLACVTNTLWIII